MKFRPADIAFCLALVLGAASQRTVSAEPSKEYVHEDAKISGKMIHAFDDNGEAVSVVLGEFKLTLGKRTISGRDAVIWVRETKVGRVTRHEVMVYVEGNAKIVEPEGTTTQDRWMLLTLRLQGRIEAEGLMSDRPLKNFPLYQRALTRRKGTTRIARSRPKSQPAPKLVPASKPATIPAKPATTMPANASTTSPAARKPKKPKRRPIKTPLVQPVSFRADRVTSRWVGEGKDRQRVTIAKGNVYMSQGAVSSSNFLELRSHTAVIFTQKRKPPTDEPRVPYRPKIKGIEGEEGTGGEAETVLGVYLEGDVVIARGERFMRGSKAYYDFLTYRAIVLDVVFRTIQGQRNIPIFIRAKEARALSAREMYFKDARISTSDFYTPTYYIGARSVYMMDKAEYDDMGVRLTPQRWQAKTKHGTVNVRGVPIFYWWRTKGDLEQGHTALRKLQVGSSSRRGWGVDTQWHMFRLLGLVRPEGFKGTIDIGYHERGPEIEANLWYVRREYSGYSRVSGLLDDDQRDDFGDDREDIEAARTRGRLLIRHKHILPEDWRLQFELSYMCDRNYLEQFFEDEFHAGKDQETLIYAKKQRDNWAFTALAKAKLNRFLTRTESMPDLGFYMIGQPLLGDLATFFSKSHAGLKRYRPDNAITGPAGDDSNVFARLDTRNEINFPLHFGPVNVVPYATGRATYWSDAPQDGKHTRPYGQVGVKTNIHFWQVYNAVESRLWDVHRLKHIITPMAVGFLAGTPVSPDDLYPMDPDIEVHLQRQSGVAFGIYQRLQTKRGPVGKRRTADWMRLNVVAGFYDNEQAPPPGDGRFFFSRPEYSIGRNHINTEFLWHISDSTLFMADANYDIDSGSFKRYNFGLAVLRNPRLRYFFGLRSIRDLNSTIGTFGLNYQINRKYSVTFFQQYDFDYNDGESLGTSITITRKLPRWYVSFTFTYDQSDNEVAMILMISPEGIPEARVATGRFTLLSDSSEN